MANQRWATAEDRCGRNLRRLREKAGLSQAELAQKLEDYGVSLHPSAIAKIEARDVANPRTVRLNEADALARALGVPLVELVSGPHLEFLEAVALLEQAVNDREAAERSAARARDKLQTLHGAMWQGVKGGISAEEAQTVAGAQLRIRKYMAKLGESDGEYPETS